MCVFVQRLPDVIEYGIIDWHLSGSILHIDIKTHTQNHRSVCEAVAVSLPLQWTFNRSLSISSFMIFLLLVATRKIQNWKRLYTLLWTQLVDQLINGINLWNWHVSCMRIDIITSNGIPVKLFLFCYFSNTLMGITLFIILSMNVNIYIICSILKIVGCFFVPLQEVRTQHAVPTIVIIKFDIKDRESIVQIDNSINYIYRALCVCVCD